MSEQAATKQVKAAKRKSANSPEGSLGRQRERLAWMLMAPTVLVVIVVALYPILRTFQLSFTDSRLSRPADAVFVGFANYTKLFTNSIFLGALWNTTVFTVASVVFEMILGIIVALVINSNFRGRGIMRTAMLIPWAVPTVVSARMWSWMYNDVFGVFNDFLVTRLGLLPDKIAWIANPATSLAAVVAVDVWKTTPFVALLVLAGLQVIPGDIYEAATVDGANPVQQFISMTLPLLRPALFVTLIFRTFDAFRVFDVIFVMKGSAPETITLAVLARQTMFDRQSIGEGSAIAVIIFIILLAFVIVYTRLMAVED